MYIPLRLYSSFSFLRGRISFKELCNFCHSEKIPACAVTDFDNLYGVLDFSSTLSQKGIQPIIGCNVNVLHHSIQGGVVLYAFNYTGYKNLISINALLSKKKVEGSCISLTDICQRAEGLSILLGSKRSIIISILERRKSSVDECISLIHRSFKDRMYFDIQRDTYDKNDRSSLEKAFFFFSSENQIPIIATHDAYFLYKKEYETHQIFNRIDKNSFDASITDKSYLYPVKEMECCFSDIPFAIEQTCFFAQRCHFFPQVSHKKRIPSFQKFLTNDQDSYSFLRRISFEGLKVRFKSNPLYKNVNRELYEDRMNYELDIIRSMEFVDYYLIVYDFIKWSLDQKIPVGPGRGSSAGSLVAWVLSITQLDPIRFGLIFERFLNPDRKSLPDFDIDFCPERRDEIINYVIKQYGYDCIAHIVTFGTLQARAAVREIGRAMQISIGKVNALCSFIPFNSTSLSDMNKDKNFQSFLNSRDDEKNLFKTALMFEGEVRHVSTHAAGIVISDESLMNNIPIFYSKDNIAPVTQINMSWVEKMGYTKFDFLGLKTLTLIQKTIDMLDEEIDINNIDINLPEIYENFRSNYTLGIFQLEGIGMKKALKAVQPDTFNDIVAIVSLFRPGPMAYIESYCDRKHNRQRFVYDHPSLKEVLSETYGIIIYQEQIIKIVQVFSGFSAAQADLLRIAIAKKKPLEMQKHKKDFIEGAIKKHAVSKKLALDIFDKIEKFTGYGFNKSHATSYAFIAYQCSYLKTLYKKEFLCALANMDINDDAKVQQIVQEMINQNIPLVLPDINSSDVFFTCSGNSIVFGLLAIKNVGHKEAQSIFQNRPKGGYKSVDSFIILNRKSLNKRFLKYLISAGCFDSLNKNRGELYEQVDYFTHIVSKTKNLYQSSMFDIDVSKDKVRDSWSIQEKATREIRSTGLFLHDPFVLICRDFVKKCFPSQKDVINDIHTVFIGVIREKDFSSRMKSITVCNFLHSTKVFLRSIDQEKEIKNSYLKQIEEDNKDMLGKKYPFVYVTIQRDKRGFPMLDSICSLKKAMEKRYVGIEITMNYDDVSTKTLDEHKKICDNPDNLLRYKIVCSDRSLFLSVKDRGISFESSFKLEHYSSIVSYRRIYG